MKSTIKFGLIGMALLFAILCLNSCDIFKPTPILTVIADPNSGHPPFETTIIAACSMGGGMYTLIVAGEDSVESSKGVFIAVVTDWPWRGKVTWINESGAFVETAVKITLENEIPIAHDLWTVPRAYEDRALILIDLRYLEHGCIAATGKPEFVSGFEDSDYTSGGYSIENDGFAYSIKIEDLATGEFESVFYGPNRILMGDEFVDNTIFYWFVNHKGGKPIYPYAVWSPMGCPPDSPPPSDDEEEEETAGKRVHVWVKEFDEISHWTYDIFAQAPTCN